MDNKKIGEYICTLRKQRNLTQKELADRLGITDKAVSKWERGAGYPDISLLKPLAKLLDTSVNELLEGEAAAGESPASDAEVEKVLEYADNINTIKKHNLGKIAAYVLSISLLLAVFICVTVNAAVNHRISWSYIVTGSCILGGALVLPPLLKGKKGIFISLMLLTLLIIPFLAVIKANTPELNYKADWLWNMALPITLTWLVFIWLIALLYGSGRVPFLFLISIAVILCIPAHIITNYYVDKFTLSGYTLLGNNGVVMHLISSKSIRQDNLVTTVSTVIGLLTAAGIFFIAGLIKASRNSVKRTDIK